MAAIEPFLVVLRESLEAFLILGILSGLVVKLGHPEARRPLYFGALAGALVSLVLGLAVHSWARSLFEAHEETFEGVAALVAVAVLTYMIVWMYRHTIALVGSLHERTRAALAAGRTPVLFGLAFVAVLREGIETVLFLSTLVSRAEAVEVLAATVLGIAVSATLALLIFQGVIRLSIRGFFAATGLMLIFIAGGLLSYGLHELAEAGWVPETPHVWDSSAVLDDGSVVGSLLKATLGYRDHPQLLEVVAYLAYVGGLGGAYVRRVRLAFRAGAAPALPT